MNAMTQIKKVVAFGNVSDAQPTKAVLIKRIGNSGTFDHDFKSEVVELVPMSFPLGRSWFVASVHGRQEQEAAKEILKLGFETFCPVETIRRVYRGRKTEVTKPVFQGYVFVSFDRERDAWGKIIALDCVIDILKNGVFPVRVSDAVMRQLMDWDSTGYFDASNKLRAGEEVEITEGPLAGLIARVKSASPRKRAKILLESILGSIEVDPCFLRRA